VRNEPDGSVRCVVEGDGDEVDRFVEAVRDAMRGNVTGIERQPAADAGGFETFEIRY
jgi:acylphosphatase